MEVDLGPGDFVLDGDPAPPPQRGTAPTQFSTHICCGQMAAWIKMPLGMELGLSPGDFVLDGDPALPSPKRDRARSPIFGPFLLRPNGCVHQDTTWYGGIPWAEAYRRIPWAEAYRPHPRVLCIRWGPSPPIFGPCLL